MSALFLETQWHGAAVIPAKAGIHLQDLEKARNFLEQ
jgi:hypothetical protein